MDWMLIIGTATFASTSLVYVWYLHKSLELLRGKVNDLSNTWDKLYRSIFMLEDRFEALNNEMYSLRSKINMLSPEIDTALVSKELNYAKQDLEHFDKSAKDARIKFKVVMSSFQIVISFFVSPFLIVDYTQVIRDYRIRG